MSQSEFQVRRATLDDLSSLVALWESMRFPAQELERRLTEFQVAVTPQGQLLGVLGMELTNRHGHIHHEAFTDFALADRLRPLLWERMQSLAANHGLVRVWTQESAPFWRHIGLCPADADTLKKLPDAWSVFAGDWVTLKLRDETAVEMTLDKEFARFVESSKQEAEAARRRGRALKTFATAVAFILAIIVIVVCFYIFKNREMLPSPQP